MPQGLDEYEEESQDSESDHSKTAPKNSEPPSAKAGNTTRLAHNTEAPRHTRPGQPVLSLREDSGKNSSVPGHNNVPVPPRIPAEWLPFERPFRR